jgi:hypothetical protein
VKTSATGEGMISIGDDGAVSGSVATKGIKARQRIHVGAAGKNGPVAVPLRRGDTYKAPAGARVERRSDEGIQGR